MNALVKADPQPVQLVAGGDVTAIIPRSIEETFRLASAFHKSGLAPGTLNSAEKVMVAIIAGAELGLPPFQSMQSFAVINNRPSLWGDGLIAVVRSNGFKVKEWSEGEGDDMVARCEVTRPDNGEVIPGEFSVADAKKAGLWGKAGPWTQHPKRMLKMRARSFACRDGAADVLRGFQMAEEVQDYGPAPTAGPAPSGVIARLEAQGAPSSEGFSAEEAPTEDVTAALDETLDGDRIPELKTGAQLLAEKMEAADPPAVPEAEFEELPLGGALDEQVDAATPPAIDPAILDQAASFKDRLAQLETDEEVVAAVTHAKTDKWFLELKAHDLAAAKAIMTAADERRAEIRAAANG